MNSTRIQRSRHALAALAVVAAAAPIVAGPAHAASPTSAVCSERITATFSPGFTMTRASGTGTSGGEKGSLSCTGTVNGHRVTGFGSVGFDETYSDANCTSDRSAGTVSVTIPTMAGPQHLVGALTARRTALALLLEIDFPQAHYSGTGIVIPTLGNCLLTPLRRAVLLMTGSLRSQA